MANVDCNDGIITGKRKYDLKALMQKLFSAVSYMKYYPIVENWDRSIRQNRNCSPPVEADQLRSEH